MPGSDDTVLAGLVRDALRALARRSNNYAAVFADRAGVRLAYHVRAGQIDRLSEEGRRAMESVHATLRAAVVIEPGLDTNAFLGRLNGTVRPRQGAAAQRR
ncbi:MAG: hypothetical protein ACRDPR_06925 [Nocardioidaceae bacterium]